MAYSCNWVQLWLTDGGFALLDISCPLTSCTTTASSHPSLWPGQGLAAADGKVRSEREGGRGPGASQELLRTHSSSSSCPAAIPINGQGVESGPFYPLHIHSVSIVLTGCQTFELPRLMSCRTQSITYGSVMNIFGLLNSEIISWKLLRPEQSGTERTRRHGRDRVTTEESWRRFARNV